jgi:aspartate aminotransferase
MFETLRQLPPDPILGLLEDFRRDRNPAKIDLGVGVYKDEHGDTPIMGAVAQAAAQVMAAETTKAYVGAAGDPEFNERVRALLFGGGHPALVEGRVVTVQTTGGCGALRIGAEFLRRCNPRTRIWVPSPTWANHIPLLGDADLEIREYPYYDGQAHRVDFAAMLERLGGAGPGDVVLLHGCCHNPCGADLTEEEWRAVGALALERGFLPFVDLAYQGLGEGLEPDAFGLRHLAATLPELLVASSCAKNFGLYRERGGAISLMTARAAQAPVAASQVVSVIRGIYSMPPHHGAAIVARILGDPVLRSQWSAELDGMRRRIQELRALLVARLADRHLDYGFIARERGLFSFLGLSVDQVRTLRERHSVYMVDSSRINLAGVNHDNVERLAGAIAQVAGR